LITKNSHQTLLFLEQFSQHNNSHSQICRASWIASATTNFKVREESKRLETKPSSWNFVLLIQPRKTLSCVRLQQQWNLEIIERGGCGFGGFEIGFGCISRFSHHGGTRCGGGGSLFFLSSRGGGTSRCSLVVLRVLVVVVVEAASVGWWWLLLRQWWPCRKEENERKRQGHFGHFYVNWLHLGHFHPFLPKNLSHLPPILINT